MCCRSKCVDTIVIQRWRRKMTVHRATRTRGRRFIDVQKWMRLRQRSRGEFGDEGSCLISVRDEGSCNAYLDRVPLLYAQHMLVY